MKKLYRSSTNKYLAGVLGGLGEYFNVDPTIFRLIFIVLLIPGIFVPALVYLVAAIIMPKDVDVY